MFIVVSKRTEIEYTVYAVDYENCEFLIFYNNQFQWEHVSLFRPLGYEEVEQTEVKQPLFRKQKREQVMYP